MDEMDDWDGDVVDLDGYGGCGDATGDPQVDVGGFESPKQRGGTGFVSTDRDRLARVRAQRERDAAERKQRRRASAEQNKDETKRRNAERRGELNRPFNSPDLAPHVAQAVAEGMAGRDLGWWRVDVDSTGRAQWTRVERPGPEGPTMTVEQPKGTAGPLAPQWHPVEEQTQPSPGTQVW